MLHRGERRMDRVINLYNLHTPFVIAFLAFVVIFSIAHIRSRG